MNLVGFRDFLKSLNYFLSLITYPQHDHDVYSQLLSVLFWPGMVCMCVCLHIVLTMGSVFTLYFVDPRDCTRACQAGWKAPTCLGIFLEGSPVSCVLRFGYGSGTERVSYRLVLSMFIGSNVSQQI